jgi:hypothetical protein
MHHSLHPALAGTFMRLPVTMKQNPQNSPKCSRCSVPFREGEIGLHEQGAWLHMWCFHIQRSNARIQESHALKRKSVAMIAETQQRLARSGEVSHSSHTLPPILCAICGTHIASINELGGTALRTMMHVRCMPAQAKARPPEPTRSARSRTKRPAA